MTDQPREKLCELIATYGQTLCDDPRRCEALLRDLCAANRREVHVLVSALRERVAADLLAASEGVPREVLRARLTQRLQDNLGLTEEIAQWAVYSWALALGKVSSAGLPPPSAHPNIPAEVWSPSMFGTEPTSSAPSGKNLHPINWKAVVIVGAITLGAIFYLVGTSALSPQRQGNARPTASSPVAQPAADIEGDSPATLSSDGRMAVFVRRTPDKLVEGPIDEVEVTEIWTSRADGTDPRMRLRGRAGPTPQETLAGFHDPQFSPDGRKVYFLSVAWVTSNAVHVLDLEANEVRYICPGNSLEVIPRGQYAGYLMVRQHRYFASGGSYDWLWLVTPDGRDVGPITKDEGDDGAKEFREINIPPGNASLKAPK